MTHEVIHGDCLDVLPTLASGSVDAVVCDPPYPCIKRSYGYWTEEQWFALINPVVEQCRRILKPTGSAVFILQPNSERVGRMRTWLWEFMARWGREWGIVQDAWWWNPQAQPTVHTHRDCGLMRPSVKPVVWLGQPDCYRDQASVLWSESDANKAKRESGRCTDKLEHRPSGYTCREKRQRHTAVSRGGVTPFNLLPIGGGGSVGTAGAYGHGAGTPLALCRWWTRYICPPGGMLLDPFAGSGTTGVAAVMEGRQYVGVEQHAPYVEIARRRIAAAQSELPLFPEGAPC